MDSSDQDRFAPESGVTHKQSPQWLPLTLVIGVAILLSVGAYYIYWQQVPTPPEPVPAVNIDIPQQADEPAPPLAIEPDTHIPLKQDEPEPLPALPSLTDSDDFIREHWSERGLPASTDTWLQGDFIIQRGVSFVDALANGALLRKLTPLNKSATLLPTGTFKTNKSNDGLWLDEANFDRYGKFVTFLQAIEPENLAEVFHWLRPLLESAYEELGQPADRFDNRLITGLNLLLNTPDIDTPIKLKRESVFYQFGDPALEALPDSQKLLLRVGPKNRTIIKQWLTSLKHALLAKNLIVPGDNPTSGE